MKKLYAVKFADGVRKNVIAYNLLHAVNLAEDSRELSRLPGKPIVNLVEAVHLGDVDIDCFEAPAAFATPPMPSLGENG